MVENNTVIEPKPNEIWSTKSGRQVLIVCAPEDPQKIGFIWFNHIDNTLSYSPLRNQLKEKTNIGISEWGSMMDCAAGDTGWTKDF